jgi:hypothetical protein
MNDHIPTLEEFKQACRGEFAFLVQSYGFHEATPEPTSRKFVVRFEKDELGVEILGEGYGTAASCQLTRAGRGPLALIYLVPASDRPSRSAKRDRMSQRDHVRELAQLARAHAHDVFLGDGARFESALSEWNRTQKSTGKAG